LRPRALRDSTRDEREPERYRVGQHVPGVRDQREALRVDPDRDLDQHEGEGDRQRRCERTARRRRVVMIVSVPVAMAVTVPMAVVTMTAMRPVRAGPRRAAPTPV